MHMGLLITTAGLAVVAIVPMAARADDCATVMAAAIAQAKTPYAGSMTITHPGQPPRSNQIVNTATKTYVQVNGAWQSMPYDAQETVDHIMDVAKKSTQACQKVGAETVNGEATTVYTEHSDNGKTVGDGRIWISNGNDLPVKLEMHFKSGETMVQESHYDNIQPPAGAP